ncbi:MAG: type II toxin-antitoxin system VapC family toxin [Alphaproteobacteria bacterium]|nr:type II toxin-antitoxin system VapC family toxin [Alphaproteobacteria bacterium]
MIGLDTNILVRYLTQDDPSQSRRATELIEQRLSEDNPGFLSIVAMAEMAWVLERSYGFAAAKIADTIEQLLGTVEVVVEDEQEVFTAMIALKEGRGSFADALIGALGERAGCSVTVTFDQKALRLPGFALP